MHVRYGREELFSINRAALFISQTQSEGRGIRTNVNGSFANGCTK